MSNRKHDVLTVANTSKGQKMNLEINLGENAIRYCLMPSLHHISAVNIIFRLWRQADVQHQIKFSNRYGDYICLPGTGMCEIWKNIRDKVLDGVSQLPVPERIRKILSNIVDPIGLEIYNWIRVHQILFYDHTCHHYLKLTAINCMDELAWTSRGRIDYKQTTKNLLDAKQLSNDDKFNLACTYCLEDDIAIIAPKVIDTLVLKSLVEHSILYFWTAHITGDFTEVDKAVDSYNLQIGTNYSTNECLFEVLIGDITNQVVIKYIFNKLTDEEKSRQIGTAIPQISNTDIICFLLSQMSKKQQQEVFKTHARKILLSLLDDWLWGKYFLPTIHNMWNVISEWDYLAVLDAIVNKMDKIHLDIDKYFDGFHPYLKKYLNDLFEKYDHYKATFKKLWQCAPKHLKENVLEHKNGSRSRKMFFKLFCKKNDDIIQSILFDSNFTQKKKIIFSGDGINACHFLITSNQWDFLKMFIEHTLVFEDDVDHFKQKLVKARGCKIAEYFIKKKKWNNLEQFENWAFKSGDDINLFRQCLTYSSVCSYLLKSIVANNKADFTELKHFFQWCTSGDEIRVMTLRAEIPQLCFGECLIFELIENGRYEFLDEMLNWCFDDDQNQIDQFKHNFYDHTSIKITTLVVCLIEECDGLQSFESFVQWCFSNEQEINNFKESILHIAPDELSVCLELLYQSMFILADEFVNWFCNSSHILINNFKSTLWISIGMEHFSVRNDPEEQYEYVTELINWFNPSLETVMTFKEKFMSFDWFNCILPALNNYVQEEEQNII